jgi:trans-aconitate methyltransferase
VPFYDTPEGVQEYVDMVERADGGALIEVLGRHLPAGSTVLEIGMGPGTDLDILSRTYVATGSDRSRAFLERYRTIRPAADLLELDAATLRTDRTFDAIYSNKVLHHLTREALSVSLLRQSERLKPGGLLMHSFWYGEKEETIVGLRFVYYMEAALIALVTDRFEIVEMRRYEEINVDDSIWVLLRVRAANAGPRP